MTDTRTIPDNEFMSSAEVAARFGVTQRAVTQWATSGRLPFERTDQGHHRYRAADIDRIASQYMDSASA